MTKLYLVLFSLVALVLGQTDSGAGSQTQGLSATLTNAQIWGFGTLAGIGISSIGFFAAFVLVIGKKCCNIQIFQMVLKFMFCLSCGALIGDAIIHILAEAYANQETNKLVVSGIFIGAILLFLGVDRLLHGCGIAHSHWVGGKCQDNHGHHHHEQSEQHHHERVNQDENPNQLNNKIKNLDQSPSKLSPSKIQGSSVIINPQMIPSITLKQSSKNPSQPLEPQKKNCLQNLKGKDSAGYMNIFGSAIHNFFDGLALGIAFATGNPTQIIPVIIAIVAHEIPRQLGDVAILLKSQFTQIQTILCNGFVNFLSLIGVFIGLAIINLSEIVKLYILVFVAGNFFYIAADIWQHVLKNKGEGSWKKNLLEVIGIGVGIAAMFLLTLLEHHQHQHQHEGEATQ